MFFKRDKDKCNHDGEVFMGHQDDLYCKECGAFLGGTGGYFDSGDMPPDDVLNSWWRGTTQVAVGLNSWEERCQEQ